MDGKNIVTRSLLRVVLKVLLSAVTVLPIALETQVAHADELTLEQVIQLALTRNERARVADAKAEVGAAGVEKARVGFLPTVTLLGSETLRPYTVEQRGQTVVRSNAAQGSLNINQTLFNASTFWLYDAAKHDREATRLEAVEDKRQLAFDAAQAYFQVLAAEQVLSASQRRLELAQTSLLQTKVMATAQINSSNDVTRSEIELAAAERSVAQAKGTLKKNHVELAFLINGEVPEKLTAPDTVLAAANAPAGGVADLVSQAVPQRPDVAALRERLASAKSSADEPSLRFVPTLSATASFKVTDDKFAGNRSTDETLTLNLNWTIWDGGSRSADARIREANASIAELQHRSTLRRVEADVKAAVVALEAAQEGYKIATRAAVAARKNADEAAVLYKEGLGRAIELLDASTKRFQAEVDMATAQFDIERAYLDLRAALGLFPLDNRGAR